jgi:hypothetical protein
LFLQMRQQRVEQTLLGLPRRQARAKFAQHGVIEARIGQLQPEQILPVQASPHGVGRRAIGQVFHELEHRRPGQAPGRLGRLPAPGEQVGEPLVRVQRTQGIGHRQTEGAVRKGGTGDAASFLGNLEDRTGLERHGVSPDRQCAVVPYGQHEAPNRCRRCAG